MERKDQQPAPEAPFGEPTGAAEEHASATAGNGMGAPPTPEQDDGAAMPALTVEAQLEQERHKGQEYVEHLQRLQAEFQNYRRRVSQEKLQEANRGKADVFRALLPILANMELALKHASQDANAVRQGVQMIWQQFEAFLRDQGVERIVTVGQLFDPACHEVLSTAPTAEGTPENTIMSEVKAGYFFDGRLLCPAQVIVAKAEPVPAASPAEA